MKRKKVDQQFEDILKLNGELIRRGNDLVDSIEKHGNLSKSDHMVRAILLWRDNLKENYTVVE